MNQDRFPYVKSTLISFGYFTNNLTWSTYNVYVPFFLSIQFKEILGPNATIINTMVAIVMILDNIAAIFIQPYIGQKSDNIWVSKLGRRMPFVIIGIPMAAFFFGIIGSFQTTLWVLIVAICGFNVSMAFYKSPVMSLVPDMLPREYRSQGSGVLNIIGGVASIIGLITVSTLVKNNNPFSFWVLSFIMLICLLILILSVKERKDVEIEKSDEKINMLKAIKSVFHEGDRILLVMLFSVFFHIAGFTVVETYISRFTNEVLGFDESTAGYILAFFVGFSIIMALPAGLVGRRIGALNACIVGMIGFIVTLIPIVIISLTSIEILSNLFTLNTLKPPIIEWTTPFYLLMIFLLGFSWLVISINSIVVIWNMSPKMKTATYTSYFYVFMHLASIFSPFIAGGVFDLYETILRSIGITNKSGLELLFVYIAVCFIISFVLLMIVKVKRTIKMKELKETNEYILQTLEEKEYPLLFLPMLLFGIGLRQEKALIELRKEQNRERRRIRKEIQQLRKLQRKLKRNVIIGDYKEDHVKHKQKIREHQEYGKERKKEYQDKKRELLEDIMKEKMKRKIQEEKKKEK